MCGPERHGILTLIESAVDLFPKKLCCIKLSLEQMSMFLPVLRFQSGDHRLEILYPRLEGCTQVPSFILVELTKPIHVTSSVVVAGGFAGLGQTVLLEPCLILIGVGELGEYFPSLPEAGP